MCQRVNHHNYDFRHRSQKQSTTLSNHIWDLKESGENYDLTWNLVETAPIFNHTTRNCRLCNREKWHIMFKPEGATLNDRSEFYSTCRHRLKNLLSNVKPWRVFSSKYFIQVVNFNVTFMSLLFMNIRWWLHLHETNLYEFCPNKSDLSFVYDY